MNMFPMNKSVKTKETRKLLDPSWISRRSSENASDSICFREFSRFSCFQSRSSKFCRIITMHRRELNLSPKWSTMVTRTSRWFDHFCSSGTYRENLSGDPLLLSTSDFVSGSDVTSGAKSCGLICLTHRRTKRAHVYKSREYANVRKRKSSKQLLKPSASDSKWPLLHILHVFKVCYRFRWRITFWMFMWSPSGTNAKAVAPPSICGGSMKCIGLRTRIVQYVATWTCSSYIASTSQNYIGEDAHKEILNAWEVARWVSRVSVRAVPHRCSRRIPMMSLLADLH